MQTMVADDPCRWLFLAKVFASTLRDDAADDPSLGNSYSPASVRTR
jgi:hypothetical protein